MHHCHCFEPDYTTWTSHEALSAHAIACLILGAEPSLPEPGPTQPRGRPPRVPDAIRDQLDLDPTELARSYERVYLTLSNAVESKRLGQAAPGKIRLSEAIDFLTRVSEEVPWEPFLEQCPFYQLVKARRPDERAVLLAEAEALRKQLAAKDEELARLRASQTYSTPLLVWLHAAIEEFYFGDPKGYPTTGKVANWIVARSEAEGPPVTPTAAEAIAKILTPADRKTGGRRREPPT